MNKVKDCSFEFECVSCPINSDREGYKVSKEAMHKYGLCFTMTEDEREQVMMNSLTKACVR